MILQNLCGARLKNTQLSTFEWQCFRAPDLNCRGIQPDSQLVLEEERCAQNQVIIDTPKVYLRTRTLYCQMDRT